MGDSRFRFLWNNFKLYNSMAPLKYSYQKKEEQECIYKMEVNAGATGDHNTHFIQAYEKVEGGLYNPEEILFVGSAAQCHQLLDGLKDGSIQRGSFSPVRLAAISRYATPDRAELDAFVGMDDKVYFLYAAKIDFVDDVLALKRVPPYPN